MRVHKKQFQIKEEKSNNNMTFDNIDYEIIYENIKNYLVFKISVTTNLNDRLAYLDILDYMGRIQSEAGKIKMGR